MTKKVLAFLCFIFVLCRMTAVPAAAQGSAVIARCETAIAAVQASSGYDSTMAETELGDMLADAVRAACGCDAAVICGGHIVHSIVYGDITADKVLDAIDSRAIPAVTETTPAGLWLLIEAALSGIELGEDELIDGESSGSFFYPQISGIELRYDASAPVGERVASLSCGGEALELSDTQTKLTIALSSDYLLREDAPEGTPAMRAAAAEQTEAQMLMEHLGAMGSVAVPAADRVKVIGTAEGLYEKYKLYRFLPYVLLVILLIVLPRQRHRLRNMDGTLSKRYKDYNVLPAADSERHRRS